MPIALGRRAWGFSLIARQRVKKGSERRRPGSFVSALILCCTLAGLVLFHVWLRLQVVRIGYVLSTTSKLQSQLEQENRELKLELATLMSPERLERMAQQRLGLREPDKDQVLVLP